MIVQDELAAGRGDLAMHGGKDWHLLAAGADTYVLTLDATQPLGVKWAAPASGTGSVTSVSVVTAHGISGSVATSTTTPAITLTLGAITPTTIVASSTIAGSNLSGTNTGDQFGAVGASKLLGNPTGSPAAASEITLAGGLTFSGTTLTAATISVTGLLDTLASTQGDILYRNGTVWVGLAPGTAGLGLVTGGAAANPAWGVVAPIGGGTGLATLTAHAVMLGEGTSNIAFATIGTAGRVLVDQGAAADPVFSATGLQIDSHQGVITTDTQSSGTWTVNCVTSDTHKITLTASITTLTLTGVTVGQKLVFDIVQGGSGSYTITWPANTIWPGGSAPTLTTTVGGIDTIILRCVSSGHYYGYVAGLALA